MLPDGEALTSIKEGLFWTDPAQFRLNVLNDDPLL
jgi:hypothetical protein